MNVLEQIVLGVQSLGHGVRMAFRPALWVPWLLLLTIQVAASVAISWFAHPSVSWFAAPLVQALAGEDALRYPNVFRLLPALFGRVDLLIVAVAGAITVGAATALFGARFEGRAMTVAEGLGRGGSRFGALVLANLPVSLLLLGFSLLMEGWLEDYEGPRMVRRLAPLLTLSLAVLLQGFFLWVNPLIVLGGRSLRGALAALPRAADRGAWTGFTLAIAATLPLLPIQLLTRTTDAIVDRGAPELVAWLMVAQTTLAVVCAFVFTASGTLAYQTLVGPALEEDE